LVLLTERLGHKDFGGSCEGGPYFVRVNFGCNLETNNKNTDVARQRKLMNKSSEIMTVR
jgi:hypothetical protein